RVDELLDQAAVSKDKDEQIQIYTEINKIWLSELPTIPLMYRPSSFQTTYEGVWTGFAKNGDGSNIPPLDCTDQAAIKDLYNLKPVKK
ncbi:MAG TPA: ABC transporter substrate-binding protein, partial [Flexilinea sp.]|nr:ABC transporter substrate-binding protein [Flexilinea sp.]